MKIAIAGFGVEGQANYRYWDTPDNELTIVDEHQISSDVLPEGARTIIGEDAFANLTGFDLVIRTAGLSPYKIKTDGRVWSATNEFFEKSKAPIIGVTGSKGKGTTCSLITSILKAAHKNIWLVGNIGVPGLDLIDKIDADDIVVYELSSFQLWDVERSPHTAVVLFIEQEHLDVHLDMNDYIAAKQRIATFQSNEDILVYNSDNVYSTEIANSSEAKLVGYPSRETAHVKDGNFYYGEQLICSVNSLHLIGEYNYQNALAAIDATWDIVKDSSVIEAGLSNFEGLTHRLKFVREVNEISFYDDSIATTPGSAIAAIHSFSKPKVIILGGSSKGSNFTELAKEVADSDTYAILIGDEATKIAQEFHLVDFHNFEVIENATMEEVVRRSFHIAKPGTVVLLSPAAASFGLFKNYVDRGEQFIAAVNAL